MEKRLQNAIRSGEVSLGMMTFTHSPALVEILGQSGFDWVTIDTEHTPFDMESAEHMVRAAETSGLTPLIRVYENNPSLILKALDTGAQGVIVPHVDTEEAAMRAVEAVKYPPEGIRGACPGVRSARYSIPDWEVSFQERNRETLLVVLLEGKRAIENLDKIIKINGIDIVFVGPWDLSQSLGCPGSGIEHPAVANALDKVVDRAKKHNIAVMMTVTPHLTLDYALELVKHGVSCISFSADELLFSEICRELAKVKTV